MRNGSRGHFRLMIILIDARPDPIAFFSLHNHQDRYTTITALSYPQRTLLKDLASSCLQSVDVLTLEVEAGKVHQATLAITGRRVIIQKGPAEPAIQTSVLRVRTPLIGKILVLRVASGRVYLRLFNSCAFGLPGTLPYAYGASCANGAPISVLTRVRSRTVDHHVSN